jgi:hypothetical protein
MMPKETQRRCYEERTHSAGNLPEAHEYFLSRLPIFLIELNSLGNYW